MCVIERDAEVEHWRGDVPSIKVFQPPEIIQT
jgi:hypothetical protein